MDNAGPDRAIFKISLAVVILQRRKVVRCVQFYWTRGYFSKTDRRLQKKKRSIRPSSRWKTVDLDRRSLLSVARLVRFWFKSLPRLTVHDRQFLQGNLFLLAVCTHDVGLYLCSIFCTRSLLQFSAASYRAFGARNTPQLYPVTLSLLNDLVQYQNSVRILERNEWTAHLIACWCCCKIYQAKYTLAVCTSWARWSRQTSVSPLSLCSIPAVSTWHSISTIPSSWSLNSVYIGCSDWVATGSVEV